MGWMLGLAWESGCECVPPFSLAGPSAGLLGDRVCMFPRSLDTTLVKGVDRVGFTESFVTRGPIGCVSRDFCGVVAEP